MEAMNEIHHGHVRDFYECGYGFLVYADPVNRSPRFIFVHHRAILGQAGYRTLPVGGQVEFEITEDRFGRHAANVRLISE
ncbi:MAG TPA: cold shock domain-containing protein [Candidatus Limnocylindrales bacterium]|nr:cold shock domain-containing protein [Candidatus Limnocylindrales bacterium]